MMRIRLCLALLVISQALRGRLEPELPESPSPLETVRDKVAFAEVPMDRFRAVQSPEFAELVRANSSKAVDLLRELAAYEDVYVKGGVAESPALKALIQISPDEGAEIVKKLARDQDDNLKYAVLESSALEALVKVRPEDAAQVVGYVGEGEAVRGPVAGSSVLEALVKAEEATQVVRDLAEDKDGDVRRAVAISSALKALVEVRPQEGAEVVRQLTRDKEKDVRKSIASSSALEALVEAMPENGTQIVVDLLKNDPEVRIQQTAVHVRLYVASSSALEAFVKARSEEGFQVVRDLGGDKDGDVRIAVAMSPALTALVEKSPQDGAQVVRVLARDEEWEARQGLAILVEAVRRAVATSRALEALVKLRPEEAAQVVRDLAEDKDGDVRRAVAMSSALKALVEVRPKEGAEVVRQLARDKVWDVRRRLAESAALEALFEARSEEGAQLVMNLLENDVELQGMAGLPVWPAFKLYAAPFANSLNRSLQQGSKPEKLRVATDPRWRSIMNLNLEKGKELLAKLISDSDPAVRRAAVHSPAWGTFFRYNVLEGLQYFNSLTMSIASDAEATAAKEKQAREKAQEAAEKAKEAERKAHEAARQATEHKKIAQGAAQAAREAQERAEEAQQRAEKEKVKAVQALAAQETSDSQRKKAEAAMRKANILLALVLLFAALTLFFATLFFSYPWFCQWREEKKIVGKAKEFLSEAESFQIVAALQPIPEPLAELKIFARPEVFNNPYILYRYNCLKPALREAFRLGRLHMEYGLRKWDFSKVVRSSGAASQELATRNYSMAREFLDEKESEQMSTLMLTCDDIQQNCFAYSSDLESVTDAVEASFLMYEQAFVAKRAYFDAMVKKVSQESGAEARLCAEKGLLRLAEKHCLRPKSGLIWDGIRAMLVSDSLDRLSEALRGLKAEQDAGRIKIVHINNRFARPTKDNWQDIAVYVMFNDTRFSGIVAEIQLVHETFLAVRTHFKAHAAYDGIRFAAEALKLKNQVEIRGLPDSQRSNPSP